jgi:hypothetical protein
VSIALDFFCGADGIDDECRTEYAANVANMNRCIDLIERGADAADPELYLN